MTRSESIATLIAALVKAQPEFKGAAKSSVNPHFKSKYADLAEVEDACLPALNKHGIAVLQPVSSGPGGVDVTTVLAHTSGEWMAETLTVPVGQNTAQAMGSAITYGRRYGLAAMVGVAPEDDDGNLASVERSRASADALGVSSPKTPTSGAPAGYHHIGAYTLNGEWHEFTLLDWDAQGGSLKCSTKLAKIGEAARNAFNLGLPVKVDVTMKKNRQGEAYANSCKAYVSGDEHVNVETGEVFDEEPMPF